MKTFIVLLLKFSYLRLISREDGMGLGLPIINIGMCQLIISFQLKYFFICNVKKIRIEFFLGHSIDTVVSAFVLYCNNRYV